MGLKILIINCHSNNRGDEAAIHAMVDELNEIYSGLKITLSIRGTGTEYPNMPVNVTMIRQFSVGSLKTWIGHMIAVLTNGRLCIFNSERVLIHEIRTADFILHAPGGPSIGDTYYNDEPSYLSLFDLIQKLKKPYMFYAPSMGPFQNKKRNVWRKRILEGAREIVLRDPISMKYVQQFLPNKRVELTMDSAFQHDIDLRENAQKLYEFHQLKNFLDTHEKCIGITITDLKWHPIYSKNEKLKSEIYNTFNLFIKQRSAEGYGILFIPQLYGQGNDYDLMSQYMVDSRHCFIIPDNNVCYDAYFQQYIIGKLYAVVGMRYHSNIFSAKMGTPFISISYEQKMMGFMEKMNLIRYCIELERIGFAILEERFMYLKKNYDLYKQYLRNKHDEMKSESYRTTEIVKKVLLNEERNRD